MKTNKPTNNGQFVNQGIPPHSLLAFSGMVLLLVLPAMSVRAQSVYSNTVMNLNPVAYWPLQETVQPPSYDIETNYGSLGPIANAYYSSAAVLRGQEGAVAGDSSVAVNNHAFAIVPTTDQRVSLQAGHPFTVECWVRQAGTLKYRGILSQTGPNNAGGLNGVNESFGWEMSIDFAPYRGTASGNAPPAWTFHVFNGVTGFTGGAEADTTDTNGWFSGGTTGYVGSWVYLCGVFDGTNCWLYAYSTNMDNATYGGTNSMNLQFPITTAAGAPVGGPPDTSVTNAQFAPDTWDPIQFGAERGLGANYYNGNIDEVAIYTNALTYQQITNHFVAGTNALADYAATILADNPVMYWRMDAPSWTNPPASSYPVAANYGSAASSMTNFNTGGSGADCSVYQPGTVPGVPGPSYSGFGDLTNACAFNGLVGAVDAGYASLLDPTDVTNNFTVVAWFKGNPMDNGNRWNCLAGHSNSSWKIQFQNGNTKGYKGAGPQPNIAPGTFNVNDDKWHMITLESTYTNGIGTNVTISLDGGVASATVENPSSIPGMSTADAFIGCAPDYLQPADHSSYNTAQQYFVGRIAHVAYFNYALTTEQVKSLYVASGKDQPPVVANIVTNTVAAGLTAKIAISDLESAAGWSDPDGNTVTLSSAGPLSALGKSVTSDANYIYYNAPATNEDHFAYTVTDGFLTASGTVYLEPLAAAGVSIHNPATDGTGHPTFSGSGIPGYTYGVESAMAVTGPWIEAGTVTAAGDGSWSFTDPTQTNPGTIFYRLYYPDNPSNLPQ